MTFNEDEGAKICAERISAGIDFAVAVINHSNKDFYISYEKIDHKNIVHGCFFVSFIAKNTLSEKFSIAKKAIHKDRSSEEAEHIASEALSIAIKVARENKEWGEEEVREYQSFFLGY